MKVSRERIENVRNQIESFIVRVRRNNYDAELEAARILCYDLLADLDAEAAAKKPNPCGMPSHHPTWDCGGMGGDR